MFKLKLEISKKQFILVALLLLIFFITPITSKFFIDNSAFVDHFLDPKEQVLGEEDSFPPAYLDNRAYIKERNNNLGSNLVTIPILNKEIDVSNSKTLILFATLFLEGVWLLLLFVLYPFKD